MKNGHVYFKWAVILIAIIFLFLVFRRCTGGKGGDNTTDTVSVKIDTVFVPVVIRDTFYTPTIVKTEYQSVPYYKTDTLETFEYIHADTARILKDYLATNFYHDTVMKNKYGYVVVKDTITKNKIAGRGISQSLSIPVVTKTVTLTQPKRVIAYLGAEVFGNQNTPLYAAGANFSIKFKNDKMYSVGAMLTADGNPMYSGKFFIPIRFKRNR